ncbi:NAD-dependent epimerase [Candidatus Steffania adelgidicola]|uniref:NAD-dependent epimerase n=1 Tax=Candidatus Steffania adelgidicola TaxID=1076626 RepID=UPI001D02BB6D|nr:NAD-dependent epimerase [Candidatus Steffania adelgidicola]UDG80034.1 UDP-N-acetylglucosamine 4-epimerase [Candidatus Steffania adelgidicola]
MKFLVTGAAGFIGYHVSRRLLADGHQVMGIDNLSDYYDVSLKKDRLKGLLDYETFSFHKLDLADHQGISSFFSGEEVERVIHLGAQVGVRHSLKNPLTYAEANLIGYLNVLEGCRKNQVAHLLYASSSSVYGLHRNLPFSTDDTANHPVSLYAATKKANELMAHTYSHLYRLPTTGLRFFSVYGPWGRPDMALFKFTRAILNGEQIDIYNSGEMLRDFTFIDDVVETIIGLQDIIPSSDAGWTVETGSLGASSAPYRIYNIGNSQPVKLMDYIGALEDALDIKAEQNFLPMDPSDMLETSADMQAVYRVIGYKPKTSIKEGIKCFVEWYRKHYQC